MAERLTPTTQCTRTLAEGDILVKEDPFPPAGPPRGRGGGPRSSPRSAWGVLCAQPWPRHSTFRDLSALTCQMRRPTPIEPHGTCHYVWWEDGQRGPLGLGPKVLSMAYKTLHEVAPADPAAPSQAAPPQPSALAAQRHFQLLEAVLVSGLQP